MTDKEYIIEGAKVRACKLVHQLAATLREFDEAGVFPSVQSIDDIIEIARALREAAVKFNTTPRYK